MKTIIKSNNKNLLPENTVLGVAGSPRRNGNSDVLLRQVLNGVGRKNIECSLIQLRDIQFQGCIGCEKCRKDKICTGLIDGKSICLGRGFGGFIDRRFMIIAWGGPIIE